MTSTRTDKPRLFPALLKYWRGRRGLSQLDLALTAEVSARHVSFLETGRAGPSTDMVLRLASALDVPMREQNTMLRAAGLEAVFDEGDVDAIASPAVKRAIARMMRQQEPYPMVVMNRVYDILDMNGAAQRLLPLVVADPSSMAAPMNAMRSLFDPAGFRPFVVDWERGARLLLARVHREVLRYPEDEASELLEDMLSFPDVPEEWRQPDFSAGAEATFSVVLERDGLHLAFLTTLTVFSAPQNVALEDLQMESYFPLDDETEHVCAELARG